jgi:GWxTD domain-containing protein
MHACRILLSVATLATTAHGQPAPAPSEVKLETWITGPVRYIIEAEEERAFRVLADDSQRALFIERFWARRDPSPDTLSNEYRQEFWERVRQANSNFTDSPRPGWMTDRGKIFILYGPPTTIEDDPQAETRISPTAGRGLIRWIYEGRPGGRTDVDPVVVVPFVPHSGEYRVAYDPDLSKLSYNSFKASAGASAGVSRTLERLGGPRRSDISVMLDLGRMQEVPPQERVLIDRVDTVEFYQTLPLDSRVFRFLHPESNLPVVGLVMELPLDAASGPPAIIARFRPQDPVRETRLLAEDSFRVVDAPGRRTVEARIVLAPGRWDLTALVVDAHSAATAMYRHTFELAEPTPTLQSSDAVVAAELAPLPYASLRSHDEPFIVGPYRVVPRVTSRLQRGETLRLFHEIYGGKPPFRVDYRLKGQEDDGRWVDLGSPWSVEEDERARSWQLPTTTAWPIGHYRVEIDITDAVGDRGWLRVDWSLEAEAAPGS